MAQASSGSSDSTASLGTSICLEKKKKKKEECLDLHEALLYPSLPGDLGRNGVDGIHCL